MRNNKSIFLVVAFYALITVPTIIYPFVKDKCDTSNYENRVLSKISDFEGIKITDFPKVFDNYLNDNIPFKNELQKTKSFIKYYTFRTPFAENVLLGKKDWLFFNSGVDGVTDTVGDYQGLSSFTNEELDLIYSNIIKVNEKVTNDGVNFHIFIPNSKSIIYREKFDNNYKVKNTKTRVDALVDKINELSLVDVIYPKESLLKYKDKYLLYYKKDTHWNHLGASVGVFDIVKRLENVEYKIDDYKVSYDYDALEDLAIMNHLKFNEKNSPYLNNYYSDSTVECTGELDKDYVCVNYNAPFDKTVMLIGDSFRISMIDTLKKTYSKVIIVYVPNFKYEMIDKYKPSDVIYEVVERNIYQLYKSFGISVITDTFEID